MNSKTIDQVLHAALIAQAATEIYTVGMDLTALCGVLVERGASPEDQQLLMGALERIAFWSGRLETAADPELAAMFPRLD